MLEQESYIEQMVVTRETIIPGPKEPQKLTKPLKPEVAEFLHGTLPYLVVEKRSQIISEDLLSSVEILYIEEDKTFWVRSCSDCIPTENKPELLKALESIGATLQNTDISDTLCSDHEIKLRDSLPEAEEIQEETADLVEDVQK